MPYSVATPGDSSVLSLYCLVVGSRKEGKKKKEGEREQVEKRAPADQEEEKTPPPLSSKKKKKLTALILDPYYAASSSISGAIILQGPHQGAQKSTSTGTEDLRTFSSQVASVTGPGVVVIGIWKKERVERA